VKPQSPESLIMNGRLKDLKPPATPNVYNRNNLPDITKRGRPTG